MSVDKRCMYSSLLPSQTRRRPKAVEPWTVKLCREWLWSEMRVWVTAQHEKLGEMARIRRKLEQGWTSAAGGDWSRFRSKPWGVTRGPECWWCEQGPCLGLPTDSSGIQGSGILMQFCLFTRTYKYTWFQCVWWFFFLAGPSWSAPRLYNVPGSPLVEVPPASARVSTCCCQLLTSV